MLELVGKDQWLLFPSLFRDFVCDCNGSVIFLFVNITQSRHLLTNSAAIFWKNIIAAALNLFGFDGFLDKSSLAVCCRRPGKIMRTNFSMIPLPA